MELSGEGDRVTRNLRSRRCSAMAEATAFIARRYFERLHIPADPELAQSAIIPAGDADADLSTNADGSATEPDAPSGTSAGDGTSAEDVPPNPPEAGSEVQAEAEPDAPERTTDTETRSAELTEPDVPNSGSGTSDETGASDETGTSDEPGRAQAWLSLGPSLLIWFDPTTAWPSLDIGIGVEFRRWIVRAWLGLQLDRQVTDAPPIRMLPLDIRVELGRRIPLGRRAALVPSIQLSTLVLRVSAPQEASSPEVWRTMFGVGAGLELQLQLSAAVFINLAATGQVAAELEQYHIVPIGAVARSPRGAARVTLSLAARFPAADP